MKENYIIASERISINLLTFRSPNHIIIGHLCEHVPGEVNKPGQVWWQIILKELRLRYHIKLL